jgi:4-hydroxy-3-polyprenylbenzoate decarboxylase
MTLVKTVEKLLEMGELTVISEPLDIILEIPHLAYAEVKKENGGKALLFTHPIDSKSGKKFDIPVVMNLFGSYKRTEFLFGRSVEGVAAEIEKLLHMKPPQGFKEKIGMLGDLFSMKDIFPKKLKGSGECQEITKIRPIFLINTSVQVKKCQSLSGLVVIHCIPGVQPPHYPMVSMSFSCTV